MGAEPVDPISKFLSFVEAARQIVGRVSEKEDFENFIRTANALVVEPICAVLAKRGADLQRAAQRWFTDFDILQAARLDWVEDSYTELMAWTLKPELHQASARDRQQSWLNNIGIQVQLLTVANPQTQVLTSDGVPDLVFLHENMTVIVEAKTGSGEHATPSGEYQTLAYPEAVRKRFNLPLDHSVYVVFITPDRQRAMNPDALTTTFASFALTLSEVLDRYALRDDLRFAFATVITHLLTCAVPADMKRLFHEGRERLAEVLAVNQDKEPGKLVTQRLRLYSQLAQVLGEHAMAQRFSGFSESARLYAKNAAVVAELQKRFQGEVDALLRSVGQSLRQAFGKRFQQTVSVGNQDKWWYCWLGEAKEKWKVPWLMIVSTSPSIVEPGELNVDLRAPADVLHEERSALENLQNNPGLSQYWQAGPPDYFGSLVLPCNSPDPLSELVGPLKEVLMAMDVVHRQFSSPDNGTGEASL